ncbi:MAG TPA: peptidylprolyl isomerase [Draconibacterium sp.]|nr:peptidylprolyl isomerase [Draconibacterium sp.]
MKVKTLITILFIVLCFSGFSQNLPGVVMKTSLGNITCEIDTVHAPVTAHNFLNHIKLNTYSDAVFYRVVRMDNQPVSKVKIEVIQGGLYADENIDRQPTIPHETTKVTGLKHLDGTISMARNTPGTASTEFFICVGDQPELDFGGRRNGDGQGFAAFGKVIEGMDVVRKIQLQKDTSQYLVEPVKILKMEITGK